MEKKTFLLQTTARLTGILLLLAIVAYATGTGLVSSQEPNLRTTGALLMFLNSVAVIAIGVLMHPVLAKAHAVFASGYLGARLVEGTLLTVGIVLLLADVPQGNFFAYQTGMMVLGLGSQLFCAGLYATRLVPRLVAIWGMAGYALLFAGAVCEVYGIHAGVMLAIPGGLFELVLGIWLIIKGFHKEDASFT